VRDAFSLDPSVTHLNHGSFGTVPRIVQERQRAIRDRAESNPQRFFRVEAPGLKAEARAVAASFLSAGADEVALVRNVTESVATVLSSLSWQGRLGVGDVVVMTEQGYESVKRAVAHWCTRTGATYDVVPLPVDSTAEAVIAAHRVAFDEIESRGDVVRIVAIDQITSPTGTVLPVEALCAAAGERGALSFVDGAHVPGHVEVVPGRTGADFWTGTWHKWGLAPRGTTALWVAEPERDGVEPVTTSWNHGMSFPLPFDTHGTDDYSNWLSLEAAIEFWRDAGGYGIGDRARSMLDVAVPVVEAAIASTGLPVTDARPPLTPSPCMRMVALPDGIGDTEERSDAIYEALSAHKLETQPVACGGRGWIRLSGAVYNEAADYERLADVLPDVLRRR
jgi:isopenicillin-N epimerase